jgi:hypothetical protein
MGGEGPLAVRILPDVACRRILQLRRGKATFASDS